MKQLLLLYLLIAYGNNSLSQLSVYESLVRKNDSLLNEVKYLTKIQLIASIKKANIYEDEYTGLNIKSVQSERGRWLAKKASEKELVQLSRDANPILRCYAFRCLVDNKSPQVYSILLEHLHDISEFPRAFGCLLDPEEVTDYFLEKAGYTVIDSTGDRLSGTQRAFIDSALLFSNEIKLQWHNGLGMKLGSRWTLLRYLRNLKPSYHKRIKSLVSGGLSEALITLARYKDTADIQLIKKFLVKTGRNDFASALYAVFIFNHPSFYNSLKQLIITNSRSCSNLNEEYISYKLFYAFMKYSSPETRKVLENILAKSDDCYLRIETEIICQYLKKYPDKIFEGLVNCPE